VPVDPVVKGRLIRKTLLGSFPAFLEVASGVLPWAIRANRSSRKRRGDPENSAEFVPGGFELM
jgi:hypothetical protein